MSSSIPEQLTIIELKIEALKALNKTVYYDFLLTKADEIYKSLTKILKEDQSEFLMNKFHCITLYLKLTHILPPMSQIYERVLEIYAILDKMHQESIPTTLSIKELFKGDTNA